MTSSAMRGKRQPAAGPVDEVVDHVRGTVLGTPTLFINGVAHRGGYDAAALLKALAP